MTQTSMFGERPQLLTFFVAQRDRHGDLIILPEPYKTREEARTYIGMVLGGNGTVVVAAGNVRLEIVRHAA